MWIVLHVDYYFVILGTFYRADMRSRLPLANQTLPRRSQRDVKSSAERQHTHEKYTSLKMHKASEHPHGFTSDHTVARGRRRQRYCLDRVSDGI